MPFRSWILSTWLLIFSSLSKGSTKQNSGLNLFPSKNLMCGLASSFTIGIITHPFDRAYNEAVKNHRAFLDRKNFVSPFLGLPVTIIHRSISGVYFIAQGYLKDHWQPKLQKDFSLSKTQADSALGLALGPLYGFVTNPITVIKYNTWNTQKTEPFLTQAKKTIKKAGGPQILFRALPCSIAYYTTFSVVYEGSRQHLRDKLNQLVEFCEIDPLSQAVDHCNRIFANTIATIAGSFAATPMIYLRVKLLEDYQKTTHEILSRLMTDMSDLSLSKRLRYIQRQMVFGGNLGKTVAGCVMGQFLFDFLKENS